MLLRTCTCSAVGVEWDSWAIGCERRRCQRQKDGYLNRSASYQRGEKDHTKSIPPPLVLERMEKVYAGHFGINQTLSSSTILYRNRARLLGNLFTPIDSFMQAMSQKYNRRGFE